MQPVANPLDAVDKDSRRAAVENRLQRAADIYRQQEHQIHHQHKHRQPEEAVEDNFIQHGGQAVRFRRQAVADGVADGGDALIACIGNQQGRVFDSLRQPAAHVFQLIRSASGKGLTVDIAFQHLQRQPAALLFRHLYSHVGGQAIGFFQ